MIDPFVDLYLFWAVLSSIIVALTVGTAVVQACIWYVEEDRKRPHRGPGRFVRWARTAAAGCRVVVSRYRMVVSR